MSPPDRIPHLIGSPLRPHLFFTVRTIISNRLIILHAPHYHVHISPQPIFTHTPRSPHTPHTQRPPMPPIYKQTCINHTPYLITGIITRINARLAQPIDYNHSIPSIRVLASTTIDTTFPPPHIHHIFITVPPTCHQQIPHQSQ